jgi:two-component system cell cycle sensor histidine kinase/response regulator CckA
VTSDARPDALSTVDDWKEALARVSAEHAKLEAMIESVPDFVCSVTTDGVFQYVNRVVPGMTSDQVLGHTIFEFSDPAAHPIIRDTIARVLSTGEPATYESLAIGGQGPQTPYLTRMRPIIKDGQIVALSVIATDISELQRATRRLDDQRKRTELAAEAAGVGYWHWDARHDVVHWDPTSCRHFGLLPDAGVTTYQGFLDRIHDGDRERIRREVDDSVNEGEYPGLQFRSITPAGETRWLMTFGRVERDQRGQPTGLLGCLLDVTERHRLEEQVLQAQRMDAVGQLAAGVAHNFNNLLAALVPTLELTARRSPESAPLMRDLQAAAQRAAEVVRHLTTFAGGHRREPVSATDAVEIARRVVELSRGIIDRAIAIDVFGPDVPTYVAVDGGEFEQALMNLVLNARDALAAIVAAGTPARIRIEIMRVADPKPRICIRVVDTGVGMTDDVRRRAIEPFFTTKPPGRGTGLGLSSTYAMVRSNGGTLEVTSSPGAGTTITMLLPEGVASPSARPTDANILGGRGERILLVDDEPAVRSAIYAVLEEEGYRVQPFGDSLDALAAFEAAPASFDALIIDRSMPRLGGQALLDRMLALAPATRAISFSGQDASLVGARAALHKPVSIEELLRTVRRVLDEDVPPGVDCSGG